jgi:hypothetical protein
VAAAPAAVNTTPTTVPIRNFYAPLRTASMDTEDSDTEESPQEEATPGKTHRPSPIVVTATVNLLQLQKLIKSVVKENFEIRNSRNGIRVIGKTLGNFAAVKSYLETLNIHYLPKSLKTIKAVIRHLPLNTPGQHISDGLMDLGFDISVKQMSTNRRSPSEGTLSKNLPLFLITLPRTAKSQEIFRLTALCHIATGLRTALRNATTANSSATFGQTVSKLLVVCAEGRPPAKGVPGKRERCLHSSLL